MNNLISIKKSVALLLALVVLILMPGSAKAQGESLSPGVAVAAEPSQPGPSDPAEMEAFLDELFAKHMEEYHIAGAAVSVVKDGQLFFAKGYGYADLENDVPVDPEKTIFRIGSVGKTFTWTAVMQLVEQGKLDLDADVNTYLDFRISDTYPDPITLKHLLTHTSWFDERWAGSAVKDANDVVPVREWLVSHMAARVRLPGDSAAYSNYNAMLAGYIVARASGQPYEQYIQEHILDPLGMVHSSAQDPLPPVLRENASVEYMYADGALQIFPDFMAQPALLPSGSHQASVTDMARFMIAHLQGGRYSDANIPEARILNEATAQQMHSIQYSPDPRFLGIAYGFFDFSHNSQPTIGHRGVAGSTNSLLLLMPDQELGVYVVYNSEGGDMVADPHYGFQKAFFDHYFPAPAVEPLQLQPPADFAERASRFVGSYRQTAFPSGSFLKVAGLMDVMKAEISDSGDGALLLTYDYGPISALEWRFVEVEPLYFRQGDGPFSISFREDRRGRITHMFLDPVNFTAFEKLDWYETAGFNLALALVCALMFLSMIPIAAIHFIRNRHPSDDWKPASPGAQVAYWIILGISILNLLIVASTAWGAMVSFSSFLFDPPLAIQISMGLGVLSAALTAGALVYTLLAWKVGYWGIPSRLYYTLVTVAAAAFVWFLNYWNLLGWRY
jgi:CubicO group peptidase (beta-lactamase class C family)